MTNVNKYRKDFADLRDSILITIWKIITAQPNMYMEVQDVNGKLTYHDISFAHAETIMSVTVKDFNEKGEKAVVWVGEYSENYITLVENLEFDLLVNLLEAMEAELE